MVVGKACRSLRPRIVATMLIATLAIMGPARAQWAVVEIGPTQFNTQLTQINTYLQQLQSYTENGLQAQRWYQTYQHYQQQLVRMQGIIKSFGLPSGQSLRPVAEDFLVADRCGGGLSLANLLHAMSPRRDGDLVAQQRELCVRMQRLQNTRYNETVKLLAETLPRMEAQVRSIDAARKRDNDNGTVDASAQATLQTMADIQRDMQEWSSRMDAYDRFLDAARDAQKQLAQMALRGERNPIGTVVKTRALKAALEAGN